METASQREGTAHAKTGRREGAVEIMRFWGTEWGGNLGKVHGGYRECKLTGLGFILRTLGNHGRLWRTANMVTNCPFP